MTFIVHCLSDGFFNLVSFLHQPLKADIIAYKPKIIEVNKYGHNFDRLQRDDDMPMTVRPRYRSLQIGSAPSTEQMSRRSYEAPDASDFTEGETKLLI